MIKPLILEDTGTFKITVRKPAVKEIVESKEIIKDPSGVISSGIYKVIAWEQFRFKVIFFISGITTIMLGTLMLLYATLFKEDASWFSFTWPSVILFFVFYKTLITYVEKSSLNKSVQRYREDIKYDLASLPAFINKMYYNLYARQVTHNWATTFITFYGSLFTLVFWWLKGFNWWILDFDVWIKSAFGNPQLMVWIFTSTLVSLFVIHIMFVVQRKKRILEMDAYFGTQIAPISEIEKMKQDKNKFFRRLFVISIIIILIIPAIIRLTIKLIKKEK